MTYIMTHETNKINNLDFSFNGILSSGRDGRLIR